MQVNKQKDDDGANPAAVVVPSARSGDRPRGVLASVLGGSLAAVLGTALHAHIWYVNGVGIPAGALASVVLATSIAVFVAVAARSIFFAALTGVVAYILVGLAASFSAGALIAAGVEVEGALPPVAIAGYVWVIGLAVGTVAAVALSWWALRPSVRPGADAL
ncbi:hypothetical protein ASH00_02045 [Arthrobacter sp. Soil782]|uniref:hypothetical protein n=1 Tax=Arthrobacter sp. Soil782 TaxID=1736410 RepID=UPI0006F93085|nr:hypothetical protein [Arthrobacter sp. Soil782]KRF08520.1 hypothetical protein ASH00_02045 [Arthrobacter sp. Soil782]